MAKATETKTIERTYTIPLRREFLKTPRWKRTKKAVSAAKQFLSKHMKSDNVKLGESINKELWKHGIKNPPGKVKVTVSKDDKGIVKAEMFGVKIEPPKQETKKKETKLEPKQEDKSIEQKKEEAKLPEAKQEQAALEHDKPEPKEEKLPPVKDDLKSTQSVPSQKNQLP
jgi:large subunit ribosomal protein L31e